MDFSKASKMYSSLIYVRLFLADIIAASLIRFFNSAPENPDVNSDIDWTFIFASTFFVVK